MQDQALLSEIKTHEFDILFIHRYVKFCSQSIYRVEYFMTFNILLTFIPCLFNKSFWLLKQCINSSFNEKDCWRKLVQNLYFTYQPFVFFKNFFVFLFLWWISRFRFKYWNNGFDNSWTWWFLKYWNETKVQIVQTLTPNQRVWFFYQFKCVIFM